MKEKKPMATRANVRMLTKGRMRATLERAFPLHFKAARLRNIIRRTFTKSKSTEFAHALDALLAAVDRAHDLDEQLRAMNPSLLRGQENGTIARARNDAIAHLFDTRVALLLLV